MARWEGAAQVSVETAHARLVELVRGRSRARIELGCAVDALAARGGHHELGYSSVGAYALQRTGLSARFVEDSRALVRRLFDAPGLPLLADALGRGRVSWSAAVRVAAALKRVAKEAPERLAEEEKAAVDAASTLTVRRLERWLAERAGRDGAEAAISADLEEDESEERHLLQRSVSAHAREVLESTRMLISFMDGPVSDEEFVDALLAEAHSAMMEMGPDMARAFARESAKYDWAAAHSDVIASMRRARARAEERRAEATEARVERRRVARGEANASTDDSAEEPLEWTSLEGWSIEALDARVVEWGGRLAQRDLEIADAALVVCAGRGWRRLGWSTQAQYAREELVRLSHLGIDKSPQV